MLRPKSIMAARSTVISHLGSLIHIKIGEDNKQIILDLINIESLESNDAGSSLTWYDKSHNIGAFQCLNLICAGCVVSKPLHMKLPFFAVSSETEGRNGKVKRIIVFVLFNGKICKVKCLPLPWQRDHDSIDNYEFCFFDGPTLLMLSKNKTSAFLGNMDPNSIFERLDLSLAYPYSNKSDVDVAKIKCFTADPWSRYLCAIIELSMKDSVCRKNFSEYYELSLDNTSSENSSSCDKGITGKFTPPKLYWPFITAFFMFRKKDLYHWDYDTLMDKNESKLFAIATENKQFLIFSGIDSMICCSIPFENCIKVNLVKLPNKETGFFLLSKSSDACLVSWKEKKVIRQWNGVQDVFFDDFLHVGHNQILILFSKYSPVEFSLTDLYCCQKESRPSMQNQKQSEKQVEESMSSVANALSSNIQAIKAKIREKDILIQRNQNLIEETWQSLENMIINGESTEETDLSGDGLVSFFDSASESVKGNKPNQMKSARPFAVLEQKQAIVFDKWVVTVKLKIVSSRPITSLSLSIVADNITCESFAVTLIPDKQRSTFEKQEGGTKRRKYENESSSNGKKFHLGKEITLVTKTTVPDFTREKKVRALLVVDWKESKGINEEPRSISCIVGTTELNSVDVIKGTYKTKDRMFYETAAVHTKFRIISKHCQLTSLERLLEAELKEAKCKLFIRNEGESLEFKNRNTFEECSEIYLLFAKSKMSVEVEMFSRNQAEANQLRHVITSLVPKDSEITLPLDVYNDLVRRLSKCMHNELSVLEKFAERGLENLKSAGAEDLTTDITEAKNDEDMECLDGETNDGAGNSNNEQNNSSTLTLNQVEQIRKNFEKKRKRNESLVKDNPSVTLDQDTYRDYLKAMQETDRVAAILFSLREDEREFTSPLIFNM